MTCPRQWTCQEQSTDIVANFGSMCKIFSGDAQAQQWARWPPKQTWYTITWPVCQYRRPTKNTRIKHNDRWLAMHYIYKMATWPSEDQLPTPHIKTIPCTNVNTTSRSTSMSGQATSHEAHPRHVYMWPPQWLAQMAMWPGEYLSSSCGRRGVWQRGSQALCRRMAPFYPDSQHTPHCVPTCSTWQKMPLHSGGTGNFHLLQGPLAHVPLWNAAWCPAGMQRTSHSQDRGPSSPAHKQAHAPSTSFCWPRPSHISHRGIFLPLCTPIWCISLWWGLKTCWQMGLLLGIPWNWRKLIGHLCHFPHLGSSSRSSPLDKAPTCCLTLLSALFFMTTSSSLLGSGTGAGAGLVTTPLWAMPGSAGRPLASSSDESPTLCPSSVSEGCSAL